MGLTSWPAIMLGIVVAIGSAACTAAFWTPAGRVGVLRWPARVAMLIACQLAAVLAAGLLVNRAYVFFGSWSELFGTAPASQSRQATPGSLDAALAPALQRGHLSGHGTLVWLPVPSHAEKVTGQPAAVYLPPQYGDPRYAHSSFPVVELFTGFAGTPRTWLAGLHIQTVLDTSIANGSVAPFIAVIPYSNIAIGRDTECVNVSGGPQVDSYLTSDVRAAVGHAFRATTGPWDALGYSTGGYCATNLTLRHPDLFSAAASLAGYDIAPRDYSTGRLFATMTAFHQNDDLWRLVHLPVPAVNLLLVSTLTDRGSYNAAIKLAADARPPLHIWLLTLPRGGHNFGTFRAELVPAFAWLSRFLSTPLTPIPTLDGLTPTEQRQLPDPTRTRLAIAHVDTRVPARTRPRTAPATLR